MAASRRFAVVGLGRFGSRLAAGLAMAGQEVIAIDKQREPVEQIRDRVDLAIALDATDEQALLTHGIDKVDVAVVGIGDMFEDTVLVTRILKDLGVGRVYARAVRPIQDRILRRVGADDVISPENESADRWAHRLVTPQFLNQFELEDGYSIVEMATPPSWVGKALSELRPNRKFGVHVLALKVKGEGRTSLQLPDPDQALTSDAALLVMGRDKDLAKLPRQEG